MKTAFLAIASLALFTSTASAQCGSAACQAQSLPQHGFYLHIGVGQVPPVYQGYASVLVTPQAYYIPQTVVRVRVFSGPRFNLFPRFFSRMGSCG